MIRFEDRQKIIDSSIFGLNNDTYSHFANPVVISLGDSRVKIFFNRRDKKNKSIVFSIIFDLEKLSVLTESLRCEAHIENNTFAKYYRDGISLGSFFELDSVRYIGFMGWQNNFPNHWVGEIGRLKLNEDFNVIEIESEPWMSVDQHNPVSLSYPAVFETSRKSYVWYGSTTTWEYGNGEMLHVLKAHPLINGHPDFKDEYILPYEIGSAQAFSRPSLCTFGGKNWLSFSFRGNKDKYKIGLLEIDTNNRPIEGSVPVVMHPTSNQWESEMVEYPYLLTIEDQFYMFYNGNGYGASGIGLCKVVID